MHRGVRDGAGSTMGMLLPCHDLSSFGRLSFGVVPRIIGLNLVIPGVSLPFYSAVMATDSAVRVGARLPDFTLPAANRPGTFILSELLKHGPVIVEFLRGTW